MRQSRYSARKKAKINKVCINRSVKYESRDDERVIIVNTETRIGVEETTLYHTNTTNNQVVSNEVKSYNGNIYLRFNSDHFKFIDVPGDGDCFYHSVLKCFNVFRRFNSVQEIRNYLKDMVNY